MVYKHFLLILFLPIIVFSQNYSLQISDLFQSCDFIHNDAYSLKSLSDSVQSMMKAKLDGTQQCNASFNQLHSDLSNIEKLINQTVEPSMAQKVFDETYSSYIVNLTQEASTLDLSNPSNQVKYDSLLLQIDALKSQLYDNKFSLQLNKEVYSSDITSSFKKDIFYYSKSLFTTLNNSPNQCIDNLGGWDQLLPVILKTSSLIGSTLGPTGAIVGAGLEASSQLAILLQNTRLKKAINSLNRRQNEKVLACAYLSMQTTACDLERAKTFVKNKEKIKEIIFRDFSNSKYEEYERFYTSLEVFPLINDTLQAIGEMGSAVTLNVDLITEYFKSVRIRPYEITYPDTSGTPSEVNVKLQKFILEMKNRGIQVSDFNYQTGQPVSISEQMTAIRNSVESAKAIIDSVILILKEKRSFIDLQGELIIKNQNIVKEFELLKTFLKQYPDDPNFPSQYKGLFLSADRMIEALISFVNVTIGNKTYDEYKNKVEDKGAELFAIMSEGSVAQITNQTTLMIPAIAFERFTRPFKALENYYLNRDLSKKNHSSYVPFADYMMNESLQVRVISDYKVLSSSGAVGRLEDYETLRNSLEKGFKKEIKKMVKDSLSSTSDVLSSFEGKTGAHLCSLFTPFLKKHDKKTFQKCQQKFKSLELLNVLEDFNRKSTMEIDYNNSCFYSDYKREESAQRILFDRLLDYGINP